MINLILFIVQNVVSDSINDDTFHNILSILYRKLATKVW